MLVTTEIVHPVVLAISTGTPRHPVLAEVSTDSSSSGSSKPLAGDTLVEVPTEPSLGPGESGAVSKAGGLATLLPRALAAEGSRHASIGKRHFDVGPTVAPASTARLAIGGHVPEDEVDVTGTFSAAP